MIESQRHSYHLVDPSPWPIKGALGALATTVGGVMYMHSFQGGATLLNLGLIFLLYTMFVWWRDVLRESTFEGYHTKVVQLGPQYGFILFIVSEVMFFFALFRASSHSSLAPTVEIGGKEPVQKIHTSTQTSESSFPSQEKMDEQGVHFPTNAKRSTVSDNKDTDSPVQMVAGKDTSNLFMSVILSKNEDEDPNGDRLVPDAEHINSDITNTSSRRDTSGNNITRSLSSGEEDYGEHSYYQDAQDPNEDDDSIALHNLDT
ncbi:hypothetical protein H5410_029422 [Solanum commersonii]|uniref:Cytochrome c oxidase subunit 3 n=1 Tax=Solanum commersonii TaxID=4109 RepID=A0A9J5Z5K7_SOLCO|nr:hypothetical protein H5410_029422 [Solanum commersonii]